MVIYKSNAPNSRSFLEQQAMLNRYSAFLAELDRVGIDILQSDTRSFHSLQSCGFKTLGDAVRGWGKFIRAKQIGKQSWQNVINCIEERISQRQLESWYGMI